MSLVLDALRRREAESDPLRRTVLDAPAAASRTSRPWIALLAVGLLLNAIALTWYVVTRPVAPPIAATEPDTGNAHAPAQANAAPSAHASAAPASAPAAESATVPAYAPVATAPVAATPVFAPPAAPPVAANLAATQAAALPELPVRTLERIDLENLPEAARSRLPGIVISSHVYADDPMERTIIANGVTLREGSVLAGLPLREIRGDSVVVEFESWLLEIPVFSEW